MSLDAFAAFDLETTGVDVEQDRIVTASLWQRGGDGGPSCTTWLVNPGVPISPEATAVHGITDEAAARDGQPAAAAIADIWQELGAVWGQAVPLVVYNAPFDLTLLDRELRRHLSATLELRGPVVDPLVIDKLIDKYRRGSRTLAAVCAHYGITLPEEDAHTSDGDCLAAARLAWKMSRHSRLAGMTLERLHDMQVDAYRAQRDSFFAFLAGKGETPDDFNTVWPLKPHQTGEDVVA